MSNPMRTHDTPTDEPTLRPWTRRQALAIGGGLGLAALLAACGGESAAVPTTSGAKEPTTTGGTGAPTTGAVPATSAAAGTPTTSTNPSSCVLTPELTEGPFYLDADLVREDITEGRPGMPLTLRTTVVDATTCQPLRDATVDVWHADASGTYSGFAQSGGAGTTYCRGTQRTGTDGVATFTSIYPGWYQGRTTHIHVKVHTGGTVVHTGQLFFEDALNRSVHAQAPYKGGNEMTNEQDRIYLEGGSASTVAVTQSGRGFEASIVLGVQA